MDLATQILQFILSISILVVLHELGHFLPAKWFKTKVEKFYLFFDPWFSVLKKKIGETEYGIGWLPFGGYVKIAGMVDESMDTEQLKKPAEPWEFRSKPAWQRLIIMLGGVIVNFLLAWGIFSALSFFNGETVFTNELKNGVAVSEAGQKIGLKSGDQILKIDGKEEKDFSKQMMGILFSEQITVLRNGKETTIETNEDGVAQVLREGEFKLFMLPRVAANVDTIVLNSATTAGLKKGDRITNINGKPIQFYDEVIPEVAQHKGKTISMEVQRGSGNVNLSIPVTKEGKIGFSPAKTMTNEMQKLAQQKEYSFLEAIPRGFSRSIEALTGQVKQFKLIFSSKVQGYKSVSGPIGIVKMMSTDWDWNKFWLFTATFSVWLAFLNLIPIPGLDGGHVVFTLWEMITGKPVPQKILEHAQMIGGIFILGLMILIFGSDIYKLIIGKL